MTHPINLILLHGLGANGADLVPLADALESVSPYPVQVFSPDAPTMPVSINNGLSMPSWFDLSVDEQGAIAASRTDLEATVSTLAERINRFPPQSPTLLLGFSQGGVVAQHLVGALNQPPAGLALLSSWMAFPDVLEKTPQKPASVFIGHGLQDSLIPPQAAEQLARRCAEFGWPVDEDHRYPMDHSICLDELADLRRWFSGLNLG